jgi:cytochrome c-type biogenesis protein CcmF
VTDAAIRMSPKEDLYVILGGWAEDGSASFKVFVHPLVVWMWVGGAVTAVGALIALWPDVRLRRPVRATPQAPVPEREVATSHA